MLQLQLVDRGAQVVAIAGRRLHQRGAAGEGDHADARTAWLVGDEGARRRLCGLDARRLDVVGAHAARDVDREDHGLVVRGQRDHRRRARGREQHRAERREQDRRRHVAPPPQALADRGLDDLEVGVTQRRLLLLLQKATDRTPRSCRHREQQPEEFGRQEVHFRKAAFRPPRTRFRSARRSRCRRSRRRRDRASR